ncbi:MAG: hypothetical protein JW734_08765 [Candidatus Omnitrophica bacterium]|nr:hypothetical protein [Candidatus Omnitrophota bacterium]
MNKTQYMDDEVDLRQFLDVIIKRKFAVLGMFFFIVLVGMLPAFFMPQRYQVTAVLRIGALQDRSLGRGGTTVVSKYEALHLLESGTTLAAAEKIMGEKVQDVLVSTEDIPNTDFVKLQVIHPDSVKVAKICRALSEAFVSMGNEILKKRYDLLKSQLEDLEKRKTNIDNEMSRIASEVSGKDTDREGAPSLRQLIIHYEGVYNLISRDIYLLREKLADIQEFTIFELDSPQALFSLTSRLKFNFIVSLIAGIIIGLFFAFVKEAKSKKKP